MKQEITMNKIFFIMIINFAEILPEQQNKIKIAQNTCFPLCLLKSTVSDSTDI